MLSFSLSLSLWLQQQLSQLSTPFLLLCQREHSRGSSTTGGCTHSRPMQGNEEEAPASAAPRECFGIRWGGNPTPARPKGLQSKPLLRRRPDLSWFCPQWMPPPRDLHPFCLLQTTWSHFLPHLEPFLICLAELQARLGYMAQLERCMWGRRLPVSLTYQKPFVKPRFPVALLLLRSHSSFSRLLLKMIFSSKKKLFLIHNSNIFGNK